MSDRSRAWRWAVAIGVGGVLVACAAPGGSTAVSTPDAAAARPSAATTDTIAAGTTAPALPDCTGGALPTAADGVLTFGTGSPALEPWFVGDPAAGQGLEAAVAGDMARVLGYEPEQITWVQIDRTAALNGAATGFDVALDRFTAPDAAAADVDYSTGYFPVTDALVMPIGSTAPAVSGLGDLRLGAAGDSAEGAAPAAATPTGYPTESAALTALTAGDLDGVLLPIHDALAAAALDPALSVVGQLPPDPQTQPEQFHAVLPGGSALTGCVSAAIDRLRVEGTLDALATQWVIPSVPVLR